MAAIHEFANQCGPEIMPVDVRPAAIDLLARPIRSPCFITGVPTLVLDQGELVTCRNRVDDPVIARSHPYLFADSNVPPRNGHRIAG